MTVHDLHDALNLLPSDLLTAADSIRTAQKRTVIPWKRILPIAACLALLICGGSFLLSNISGNLPLRMKQESAVAEAPAAAPMAPLPVEEEIAADEAKSEAPAEMGDASGRLEGETCIDHSHDFAEESDRTVNSSNYCGNMLTTVYLDEMNYTLAGSYSATITDVLVNLEYNADAVCRCMAEFTVDTETLTGIQVNLDQAFARCELGQAALTETQVTILRDIVENLQ